MVKISERKSGERDTHVYSLLLIINWYLEKRDENSLHISNI
jgi:hypothetical protein